jgi:uncharacterized protein YciI
MTGLASDPVEGLDLAVREVDPWSTTRFSSSDDWTCPAAHGRRGLLAMFHVVITRSGPEYDLARPLEEQSGWQAHAAFMDGLVDAGVIVLGGPLSDEYRVVHAIEAESEAAVRAMLARDPWSETHLVVEAVDPGRSASTGVVGPSRAERASSSSVRQDVAGTQVRRPSKSANAHTSMSGGSTPSCVRAVQIWLR